MSSEAQSYSATVDAPPAEEPNEAAAAIDLTTLENPVTAANTPSDAAGDPLAAAALPVSEAAAATAATISGVYPAATADTTVALPAAVATATAAAAAPALCVYNYTETDIRPMRVM